MDPMIIMWLGFILAAYSVVGNDVIQTLGTFLASNENRPWYVLWAFAATIMTATLVYGWFQYSGDVSYQRLLGDGGFADPKYKDPRDILGFGWPYLLPPLVLMVITRFGIPVSTSFLILTFFNPKNLESMVIKSMTGYLVAFGAAIILYMLITKSLEKKFVANPIKDSEKTWWTVAQWASTGFLWTQWLAQDFANIYVYLPRQVDGMTLAISLAILLSMLAYIFYSKGGAIQKIVRAKTNTTDIRSATFIDLSYGIVLYFFKELNNIPMSTTWVFLGLLAGREIAVRYNLSSKVPKETLKDLGMDLAKVFFGLAISIALVFLIRFLTI
ncbi:MAG: hypothetical protein AB8G22_27190 [Saprospiraceae bacterium]